MDEIQKEAREMRRQLRQTMAKLDRMILFQEAVTLAVEERLGHAPPDPFTYTPADAARAKEIMALYRGLE